MGCSMDGILDGDVSCEEDVNPAMLEELLFKLTDEKKVLEKEGAEVARMEEELDVKIVLKEQFLTGFLRFDKDVQEVVDTIGQKQKILNEMESGTSSEHQELEQMRSRLTEPETSMAEMADEERSVGELLHLCAMCDVKLKAIKETIQLLYCRQRQLQDQQHSPHSELAREEANRQLDAHIYASGLLR
uniref:uncharacterized protein isoform X2 n=1 Tax=Myxine glutinosa TaxID=7769 RepID=UPI00358EACFE